MKDITWQSVDDFHEFWEYAEDLREYGTDGNREGFYVKDNCKNFPLLLLAWEIHKLTEAVKSPEQREQEQKDIEEKNKHFHMTGRRWPDTRFNVDTLKDEAKDTGQEEAEDEVRWMRADDFKVIDCNLRDCTEAEEPCREAVVLLKILSEGPDTYYAENSFVLQESSMQSVEQFFNSLGMEAADRPEDCDWEGTVGKRGRAFFPVEKQVDRYGENHAEHFLTYSENRRQKEDDV